MSSVNSQALSFLEVDTDLLANTQASSQFEYPDFTISSQSQTQTQLTQNDSVKDQIKVIVIYELHNYVLVI